MPSISLSGKTGKGKYALVDDSTFKTYGHLKWYLSLDGYVCRVYNTRLHRLVMGAEQGEIVDHLNGNKLDNRRNNLRICSAQENVRNCKTIKGYTFDKSVNLFMVRYNGKFYGRYKTESEAKKAFSLAKSGVPKINRTHPRRKYLPKGVFFMKGQAQRNAPPYYVHPKINGSRHFKGYFSTVQEAELAYHNIVARGG